MTTSPTSSSGLLQQTPFVLFWLARLTSTMGYQMLALMIGWQVYALTGSAFWLSRWGRAASLP